MKILEVAERTYPARGGVELHTAKISEALVKKGHDVTLVVFNSIDPRDCGFGISYQKPYLVFNPNKPVLLEQETWHGVKILRFRSKGQILSYYWSPAMLKWLLGNGDKFDIMHTHTLKFSNNEFTALANLRTKTPFVLTGHVKLNLDYMGALPSIIDKLYRFTMCRLLLNRAQRLIAFDQDYFDEYHKLYGIPERKIRIIPNGIDNAYYNNLPSGEELRERLGNPEQIVLYVGRFIDYKNPHLLIASFKKVVKDFPKACLLMLGKDHGLLSICKKLRADLGLKDNVVFIDDATETIKLQALSIADVCVIPSYYESFGLVALEAEASGVPIIASNSGGLTYLLEEGKTGLFLKKRTTEEIAEKVILLLNKDGLRKRMSLAGKEFAKKYSWSNVTEKLLDVYSEVAAA